jgi:hypothetical protein
MKNKPIDISEILTLEQSADLEKKLKIVESGNYKSYSLEEIDTMASARFNISSKTNDKIS